MPSGPASSESKHVFLVGTHTHIPDSYIHAHMAGHTCHNPGRKDSTHANTNSTNGLILFPFLAER